MMRKAPAVVFRWYFRFQTVEWTIEEFRFCHIAFPVGIQYSKEPEMKSLFFAVFPLFFAGNLGAKPNKAWVQHIQDTFQAEFVAEHDIEWSDKTVTYEVFAVPTVALNVRMTELMVPNGASDKEFRDCEASAVFSAGFVEGLFERALEKKAQGTTDL